MNDRQRIINYLEEHPETDNLDISINLNISISKVGRILNEFINEGICMSV
jgi:DNA-binding Lrp family transcriptional regulator